MSDGLTLLAKLTNIKDGVTTLQNFTDTFTITNSPIVSAIQSIPTSWTAINLGSVTSLGYIIYKNLNDTNYLELSADSGGANPLVKAKALDFGMFRLTGSTLFARSNTTACLFSYTIISN
jgi:hypothetical protein